MIQNLCIILVTFEEVSEIENCNKAGNSDTIPLLLLLEHTMYGLIYEAQ